MSEELNEKLKLVAEYMDYPTEKTDIKFSGKREIYVHPIYYNFDSDYREQIPVWQKLCKEHLDIKDKYTDDLKQFMLLKEHYCKAICYGTPLQSFEILVQAIKFINSIKTPTDK